MSLKRLTALALSLLLILSLCACGVVSIGDSGSVYWLNFKPELDDTLQSLASQYKEQTGVDVKVVTPASGTYQETLREEMESENPPTMYVINNLQAVREWGATSLDLKDTDIQKQLVSDKTITGLSDESGKLVALPYCQECFGIAVNRDMTELVGIDVRDIRGFDDLKAAAELIHNNASWLGFDAFCSLDLDAESSWRVTGHLVNLEYYYERRDSSAWAETPPTLTGAYLDEFRNLYDLCINNGVTPPEQLAQGGHHPVEEFCDGKAAFLLTGSWDYAKLKADVPNLTMFPYYCGYKGEENAALNVGTENYWAVNANCSGASQKATIAFMCWLVSDPDASAKMAEQLGYLPYKNAAKSDNGFLQLQKKHDKAEHYAMDWLMKYQPNQVEYRVGLVEALTAYNADQTDANWEKFRTAFVDGWAQQYVATYD